MDLPLVSIIMPTFNAQNYVAESIESILHQTYKNWELIIIDDGSEDKTLDIIKSYECDYIKTLSKENKGQSTQLNLGISLAKGKYIAIAHADDVNHPERIKTQLNYLLQNPGIKLCGSFAFFKETNREYIKEVPTTPIDCYFELFFGNPIIHPTVMFDKESFTMLDYFYNISYDAAEDYDLWVRLSNIISMSNVDKPLVTYRVHPTSNSSLRKTQEKILEKRIRLKLVKQLIINGNRNEKLSIYNFFYRRTKSNIFLYWKCLLKINEALCAKNLGDDLSKEQFITNLIIKSLKEIPYRLRVFHLFFSPLLFKVVEPTMAFRLYRILFFSKSI